MWLRTYVYVFLALWIGTSVAGYRTKGYPQFVLRCISLILCTCVASMFGIFAGLVLFPAGVGYNVNHYTGVFYAFLVSIFVGVEFQLEGEEHLKGKRPAVFVANHQSSMDVASIGRVFPERTAVMAKRSIAYIPFLGWYTYLAANIFIDRKNRSSAMETMQEVARLMEERQVGLWMFAEGTRSRQNNNSLLPFKKGAFHLAMSGKMPIVPIVISTYGNIYSTKAKRFEGGVVKIKVLPPILPEEFATANVDDLITRTRDSMLKTLQDISPPVTAAAEKKTQ